MILSNYINAEATIKDIIPCYVNHQEIEEGRPSYSISVCDDNSAFIKPTDLDRQDLKVTLFPPPSAHII
jgi:hypothetical protein